jgi:hypothetical protein
MKKMSLTCIAILMIAVICIGSFYVSSSAASTSNSIDSQKRYATVYGYNYSYWSRMTRILNSSLVAGTVVKCTSNVPIGNIGEVARLYLENDPNDKILLTSTPMTYNTNSVSANTEFVVSCMIAGQSGQYYFSQGLTRFYNENDYLGDYVCCRTANMGLSSSKSSENSVVNEKTNNSVNADDKPTKNITGYILAKGVNGRIGYVKESDLENDQARSPEEAMLYMQKLREDYENGVVMEIPVYAADCETIIDAFVISYPLIWEDGEWVDLSGNSVK